MQMGYDLYTLIGVLFVGQDPAQWPPIFEAPWRATSLNEFWGRSLHQWNRRMLVLFGGYPFSIFFGCAGLIIITFVASGINVRPLVDQSQWKIGGLEDARWVRDDGPRGTCRACILSLDGQQGRWGDRVGVDNDVACPIGTVLTEGCARAGGFGDSTYIDIVIPVRDLVE